MIKIENEEVVGWEHAIRGMRNPKNSWDRCDSGFMLMNENDVELGENPDYEFVIGENDSKLMTVLRNAGTDHRKYMRMITVYLDIIAPLYWWKEFDTYKVGTVANSCSTMHKIHAKEFTLDDFSCENLVYWDVNQNSNNVAIPITCLSETIAVLNSCRDKYIETKDKLYWEQMIQLLPSSYNQKRTVMLNYEVLANMYKSRKNHKLAEWREFCKWVETLPYSELITGKECGTNENLQT